MLKDKSVKFSWNYSCLCKGCRTSISLNVFPSVKVTSYFFHFGQSLFKNFLKHGMKTLYILDEQIQKWFKKVFIIVLMQIEIQFIEI